MTSEQRHARSPAEGPSRTLAKGLKVLDLLARADGGMRATEVARAFGLNLNTASRMLATLEASGFVNRDPNGAYGIGAKMIAAAVRKLNVPKLTGIARPYLMALREATSETSFLVARVGLSLVILDVVEGKHDLRVVLRAGDVTALFPATTAFTSTVDLPAAEVAALSRKSGNARRTVTEADVLAARAELTKQGYLVRHAALHSDGTCTAAAPVRSRSHVVASIGIAGPSQRWNEAEAKLHGRLFRRVSQELSSRLDFD